MSALDLNVIRDRNENWRRQLGDGDRCQECAAGQIGYPAPADIDALLAEVERLERLAYIGEHHVPDLTYKARLEEMIPKYRALAVEVQELRTDFKPGRWWRVLQPNGKLWNETSDEEAARESAEETGWQLQRQWYIERTEWRNA